MHIPSYTNHELEWWINNVKSSHQNMKTPKNFQIEIFTDASKTAWGACANGKETKGFWSTNEQNLHINQLELRAAFYGLQSFAKEFSNCAILLRIYNKTAIACINKKGSVQFPKLNKIVYKIWHWCE